MPGMQQQSASKGDAPAIKGITKAAIMLIALDGEASADVLRHLDGDLVEELTREIAHLDLVKAEERGQVMVSLPVYDRSGAEVGTYQIDPAELAPRVSKQLLHDVVVMYQANRRQGSAKTKNRSEVEGSTGGRVNHDAPR